MSEQNLEIFILYDKLAEMLGDKEAIADIKKLYERHPEMFKNIKEVSKAINEVVSEPEIIIDANRDNKNYKVIKAVKRLDDKKMGDVVIKNENGINEIFHANKKRIKEFNKLQSKENLLHVETPTPSTHQLNGLELIDKNLSGANTLYAIENKTIPHFTQKGDNMEAIDSYLKHFRALDSKERDVMFQSIKEEYTEIKELEATGFIPLEEAIKKEQKKGMKEINKTLGQLRDDYYFKNPTETQKAKVIEQIQQNLSHIEKELPSFAKEYPNTYKNINDVIKTHEKKMAQQKAQAKGGRKWSNKRLK